MRTFFPNAPAVDFSGANEDFEDAEQRRHAETYDTRIQSKIHSLAI